MPGVMRGMPMEADGGNPPPNGDCALGTAGIPALAPSIASRSHGGGRTAVEVYWAGACTLVPVVGPRDEEEPPLVVVHGARVRRPHPGPAHAHGVDRPEHAVDTQLEWVAGSFGRRPSPHRLVQHLPPSESLPPRYRQGCSAKTRPSCRLHCHAFRNHGMKVEVPKPMDIRYRQIPLLNKTFEIDWGEIYVGLNKATPIRFRGH
eukprot:CAMPEP_0204301384 /NCGR_PEP_ID=MMETSP0468-20130131/80262_1 /ASSEMBLY_ACC=CAM_ASM_000383 /TAXON_ID=2969 /ORGANISM="Oxyrrhis marina" /LENGTH=203 /DNA_ID=CAMNT_0051280517 /DNA_START=202 /DNA_END=813 /DNA_ORIENTATION=+